MRTFGATKHCAVSNPEIPRKDASIARVRPPACAHSERPSAARGSARKYHVRAQASRGYGPPRANIRSDQALGRIELLLWPGSWGSNILSGSSMPSVGTQTDTPMIISGAYHGSPRSPAPISGDWRLKQRPSWLTGGTRRSGMRPRPRFPEQQHCSINTDGGFMTAEVWDWIAESEEGKLPQQALIAGRTCSNGPPC